MSRITDDILSGTAYSKGATSPMLSVGSVGYQGFAPNLASYISSQAYVRRQLIPILLEAPRFMQVMPDPDKWVQSLKSLIELHSRTIEGFNAGLTVELDEHPVGGAGEFHQEFTDVKRARTEPSFTFVEKYGRPIQTFLDNWIRYGMMDPDTKSSLLGTLPSNRPDDLLADWYSMTCLFIEPDPLHRKVVQAWITTNMFPKGNGEITGKRDLTTASEVLNLTIEFTGITQYGLGVNVFAQQILDTINIDNANPYLRPAFISAISPDVDSAAMGYAVEAADLGSSSIEGVAKA